MLDRSLKLCICCLALLAITGGAEAQQPIPARSLDAMQQTLGDVRDRLYEANDAFWHRGQYERCIATLRLITEMDPQDTEAFDNAAWLMENQLRDDECEAFRLKGIRMNPDEPDLYFSLGYFYYMRERYPEAISYMERAVSLGSPLITRHMLAHAYESANDTYDALAEWLQIEDLEPGDLVPTNQIDRILQGEPDANLPRTMTRWREERKAQQKKGR